MIVVSDTSPINYLVLIRKIELLPELFDEVIIPQAVLGELRKEATPEEVRRWIDSNPRWLKIQNAEIIDETITLGAGEREAISLAEQLNADLILIDDRKARITAINRGLKVAGTINILESVSKRGLVNLSEAFQKLEQTSFRIAPDLLAEILKRN
jgi:predicted nucleic acid-binding protein